MMKMFIVVHEGVPDNMVPVLVAHAVLNADTKFAHSSSYLDWKTHSYRKVVVRVNQKEFDKIRALESTSETYERSVMDGAISCLIPLPREETPNVLKFAQLWVPRRIPSEAK